MIDQEETLKTLAERIRIMREVRGLTQADVGRYLGTSRGLIGAYENGSSIPPLVKLIAVANILEVSIGFLLGEETFSRTPRPTRQTRR